MSNTPEDRLLDLMRAPMAERGFELVKSRGTFERKRGDAEVHVVLDFRAKYGLWKVLLYVRVFPLPVRRRLKAAVDDPRTVKEGLSFQIRPPEELLKHDEVPFPHPSFAGGGLRLDDGSLDVPPKAELERQGITLADYQHPQPRLEAAAEVLLGVVDRFAEPEAARLMDPDTLRALLAEEGLAQLKALLPNFARDGWQVVALAQVYQPAVVGAVVEQLRAAAQGLPEALRGPFIERAEALAVSA